MFKDNEFRERRLEQIGFPKDYIDVYLYIITGDNSFLSEEYFVQYPTKRVVDSAKIRKVKEEMLILALRYLIYGEI